MKTLYIGLLAAVAAGVIALVACSDTFSTDEEVKPLAVSNKAVYGYVTLDDEPVDEVPVFVYKRTMPSGPWIYIAHTSTNEEGYYEIDPLPGIWPAGQYGKSDCTNDIYTGLCDFSPYPQVGPVRADVELNEN